MAKPHGFTWEQRRDGSVVISHRGRQATVLRGTAAAAFLATVDDGDRQELMARTTGNYKRGNERA